MILDDFKNRRRWVKNYLIIVTIFMILPIGAALRWIASCICCCLTCCKCEKKKNNLMFKDVSGSFTSHYDTTNPVSST